jgi:hypothetical protein
MLLISLPGSNFERLCPLLPIMPASFWANKVGVPKGFLVQLHGQSAHLRTPTAVAFHREDFIKRSKVEVKRN